METQTPVNVVTKEAWFHHVYSPTCCNDDGIRGDVRGNGSVNIQDLTYLVNYLFESGPPPPCEEEGDLNGNGYINVEDLTYLVNFLFKGGSDPVACP